MKPKKSALEETKKVGKVNKIMKLDERINIAIEALSGS